MHSVIITRISAALFFFLSLSLSLSPSLSLLRARGASEAADSARPFALESGAASATKSGDGEQPPSAPAASSLDVALVAVEAAFRKPKAKAQPAVKPNGKPKKTLDGVAVDSVAQRRHQPDRSMKKVSK